MLSSYPAHPDQAMPAQTDNDLQQLEQQMEEQESPVNGVSKHEYQSTSLYSPESLQGAAQYFLSAQNQQPQGQERQQQQQEQSYQQQSHSLYDDPVNVPSNFVKASYLDFMGSLSDSLSAQLETNAGSIPNPLDPNHSVSEVSATKSTMSAAPSLSRKSSAGHRGQKHKWSQQETQALVNGCNKHGVGNWKKILSDPEFNYQFLDRSAGDLKDRFRTYFPDTYHEMYPNAKTHLSKTVRGRDADGKSIFEKGKTKERRPFTPEEDAALKRGYADHGSHWAMIAKYPIFNKQRRAIDLRDRFRNAFPSDYERAGFKPRPSKSKKDRCPNDVSPAEDNGALASIGVSLSDHGFSDNHPADLIFSDASDGHLTDHANLTDSHEGFISGRSSSASSVLGRSNSFGAVYHSCSSKLQNDITGFTFADEQNNYQTQAQTQMQTQTQLQMQAQVPLRPSYVSTQSMPLPSSSSSVDLSSRLSIGSLFEQLPHTSLDNATSSSETSSVQGRASPISDAEPLSRQTAHSKTASAEESRCQAGKPKDAATHKRRSHSSKAGKSSALERLPSALSHLHSFTHSHCHLHSHVQPAVGPQHAQLHGHRQSLHSKSVTELSHTSAEGETSWPASVNLSPIQGAPSAIQPWRESPSETKSAMEVDEPMASANAWPTHNSSASEISGASASTPHSSIYSQIDYPNMHMFEQDLDMQIMQNRVGHAPRQTSISAQPSVVTAPNPTRDVSVAAAAAEQTQGGRADTEKRNTVSSGELSSLFQSRGVWPSAMDAFLDPLQDLLDPVGPTAGSGPGWASGWALNANDPNRSTDGSTALLSSTPMSHHHWAGDLHHASASANNLSSNLLDSLPDFMGELQAVSMGIGPVQQQTRHTPENSVSGNTSASESHGASLSASPVPAGNPQMRDMSVDPQEHHGSLSSRTLWTSSSPRQSEDVRHKTHQDPSLHLGNSGARMSVKSAFEEILTRSSRSSSITRDMNADQMMEAFNDAVSGLGSDSMILDQQHGAPELSRRRSNDTLRNEQGTVSVASVCQSSAQRSEDGDGFVQQPNTTQNPPSFLNERRNSVPATAGSLTLSGNDRIVQGSLQDSLSFWSLNFLSTLDQQRDAQARMPTDSTYAASLPDTSSGAGACFGGDQQQQGSNDGQSQHHQQAYSYDDIDLAVLSDLARSPLRLSTEPQAFFPSLNQPLPPWSSLFGSGGDDPVSQTRSLPGAPHAHATEAQAFSKRTEDANHPASGSMQGFNASSTDQVVKQRDHTQGWENPSNIVSVSSLPMMARSASVSHIGHRPQLVQTSGLNSNSQAASQTITPSSFLNAFHPSLPVDAPISTASLWASSGSLDRLEHLYLEGLHSSPSLGSGGHLANSQGGGGGGGGAGGGGSGYLSE